MRKRLFVTAFVIILVVAIVLALFAPRAEMDSFVTSILPADIVNGIGYGYSQYYNVIPQLGLTQTMQEGFLGILLIAICALVLIIIVLIISLVLGRKHSPKTESFEDARRRVSFELKAAEKSFLKHKIDKPTFDSISEEKNKELIRIESEIDAKKHSELGQDELKSAEKLSEEKKKVLLGLLGQKQKKVNELKIAERSYLKRKIDEATFGKISNDIKREIIDLEGQIKAVQESEAIEKLKAQLKEGASQVARQQKLSEERKSKDYFEEMQGDVLEQAEEL